MTPIDLILAVLALWIVTHTVSTEIPITAKARKPLSCQLCLSGWVMIVTTATVAVVTPIFDVDWGNYNMMEASAIWAGSVLLEQQYRRLQTIII